MSVMTMTLNKWFLTWPGPLKEDLKVYCSNLDWNVEKTEFELRAIADGFKRWQKRHNMAWLEFKKECLEVHDIEGYDLDGYEFNNPTYETLSYDAWKNRVLTYSLQRKAQDDELNTYPEVEHTSYDDGYADGYKAALKEMADTINKLLEK